MKIFTKLKELFKGHKGFSILFIIVLLLCIVCGECAYIKYNEPIEVTYSDYLNDLKSGKIDTVYYNANEEMMRYTLFNEETRGMSSKEREDYKYDKEYWRMTKFPAGENFRKDVLKYDTNLVVKSFEPVSISIIASLSGVCIPLLLFFCLIQSVMGNNAKFEGSDLIRKTDVKFSDVIGHDEVIKDLQYILKLLKNPKAGAKLGVTPPRGILFSGKPGTGKTLLAKAIAGECGVPFIYMNASKFIELYVGVGAKRVRDLFKMAKKVAPCIIFIDEIDAVGKKRGGRNSHSENDQTLDALLQELDGFDTASGIFVIAATNDAESLDSALVRAGRFDRQVIIAPPRDWNVRLDLFKHYLKDTPVNDSLNLKSIAKQTSGFTGADISTVVNESKLIAMMRNSDVVDTCDIEEAIDKKIFKGNKSEKEQYKRDKEIVAYHEAGHAVMTYLLHKPIARISIVGNTSGVGGYVSQYESKSQLMTEKDFESQIMIALGGRCSEAVKFVDVTTGASNDITQATQLAYSYIFKNGFDSKFGMVDIEVLNGGGTLPLSNEMVKQISCLVNKLHDEVFNLLSDNYFLVECLADKLLELDTISGDVAEELLNTAVQERGLNEV